MQPSDTDLFADDWSDSFASAVRHAFFVDRGIEEDRQIAALLGITAPALSQQLGKSPLLMKGESLARILRQIRIPELRDEVVLAWSRELTVEEPTSGPGADWAREAHKLVSRNRPDLALRIAVEAFEADRSPMDRWIAFKMAISCCFRLDLPGESMRLCGKVREWGERDGMPELVAVAHALGSRAMRRTTLFAARQVNDERQRARTILIGKDVKSGSSGQSSLPQQAAYFAHETLSSEQTNEELRVQDLFKDNGANLERILANKQAERERSAGNPAARARAAQSAARILLALGRQDEAEKHVREAMEQGERHPAVLLEGEHLLGRLLAERGNTEEALIQLRRAAKAAERLRFVYVGRVIETEITRIELANPPGSTNQG